MSTPAEQLERALDLTHQMLTAAEAEEWETLARIQAEREPLIREALADPASLGTAESRLGDDLLALNQRVASLAGTARTAQGEASRQMARGRRAVRAYNRHEP